MSVSVEKENADQVELCAFRRGETDPTACGESGGDEISIPLPPGMLAASLLAKLNHNGFCLWKVNVKAVQNGVLNDKMLFLKTKTAFKWYFVIKTALLRIKINLNGFCLSK